MTGAVERKVTMNSDIFAGLELPSLASVFGKPIPVDLSDPGSIERVVTEGVNLPWTGHQALRVATSSAAVERVKGGLVSLKEQLVGSEVEFIEESQYQESRLRNARTRKFHCGPKVRGKARLTAKAEWQKQQDEYVGGIERQIQLNENRRTVARAELMLQYNKLVLQINELAARAMSAQRELGLKPSSYLEENLITEVEVESIAQDAIHAREEAEAIETQVRELNEQRARIQNKLNEVQADLQESREALSQQSSELSNKVQRLMAEARAKRDSATAAVV